MPTIGVEENDINILILKFKLNSTICGIKNSVAYLYGQNIVAYFCGQK